jgi:hypothetical protein
VHVTSLEHLFENNQLNMGPHSRATGQSFGGGVPCYCHKTHNVLCVRPVAIQPPPPHGCVLAVEFLPRVRRASGSRSPFWTIPALPLTRFGKSWPLQTRCGSSAPSSHTYRTNTSSSLWTSGARVWPCTSLGTTTPSSWMPIACSRYCTRPASWCACGSHGHVTRVPPPCPQFARALLGYKGDVLLLVGGLPITFPPCLRGKAR